MFKSILTFLGFDHRNKNIDTYIQNNVMLSMVGIYSKLVSFAIKIVESLKHKIILIQGWQYKEEAKHQN